MSKFESGGPSLPVTRALRCAQGHAWVADSQRASPNQCPACGAPADAAAGASEGDPDAEQDYEGYGPH
jgi:hypothetical protein